MRAQVERLLRVRGCRRGEIMVVSPYNVQVNALREALPAEVPVGTVDKFQGQEAQVVLYSLASSSGEDVPARARVPALAQPAERCDLAGTLPRLPRVLAAPARGELPLDPADAARERVVPVRRGGGGAGAGRGGGTGCRFGCGLRPSPAPRVFRIRHELVALS